MCYANNIPTHRTLLLPCYRRVRMCWKVRSYRDHIPVLAPPSAILVFTNKETGLLSAAPRKTPIHFIDCSTIETATSVEVGKQVAQSTLGTFIDAPVSGGPNGANSGTLAIMVGGSEEDWERAEPILRMMGKSIFHCGPPGAGLATKQINNYLSSVCTVGVCEAMNMGVKYGLDPKKLADVINVSSGRCYNSLDQNPVKGVTPGAASERDFAGGFSVELCKGVLDMAVALGEQVGARLVLSDRVLALYDKALKDERTAGRDSRSIYRFFADGDVLD
ncbi:6-phosphogluconate dehydrogenase [Nemania serpens]|nr:6-phosphogluconate dehydrogenase [Nemania serpens]